MRKLLPPAIALALCLALMLLAGPAHAQLTGLTSTPTAGGGQEWSINLQLLLLLSSMAFLPAVLLMMTSFTRIVIVLSLLRTAMGTQAAPPNQVLIGMALFLSLFIMSPVLNRVYEEAWKPMSENQIGFEEFVQTAGVPMREFMLAQTRETDLAMFAGLSGAGAFQGPDDVPFKVLIPSFITSELKTAFQIGFTIFIPFLIIDLVVASVLMALGMMMVPPATISMPFKLMLFVLVDGWQLLIGSLAQSFVA
ncbi:flagellar type III secretion system pore protein FliP [Mangrovimicrobium sediminis]|nr:flagellar type III secretion system pore protein FliP [Haliea sp. SAOS-164]